MHVFRKCIDLPLLYSGMNIIITNTVGCAYRAAVNAVRFVRDLRGEVAADLARTNAASFGSCKTDSLDVYMYGGESAALHLAAFQGNHERLQLVATIRRFSDDSACPTVVVHVNPISLEIAQPDMEPYPGAHCDVVSGLRKLRSALARLSFAVLMEVHDDDAVAALRACRVLSYAAGALLASNVAAHERAGRAQRLIRRAWTSAVTDPTHPACQRRLLKELDELHELLI